MRMALLLSSFFSPIVHAILNIGGPKRERLEVVWHVPLPGPPLRGVAGLSADEVAVFCVVHFILTPHTMLHCSPDRLLMRQRVLIPCTATIPPASAA